MDPLRELEETARQLRDVRLRQGRERLGFRAKRTAAGRARLEARFTVLLERWLVEPELRRRWHTYAQGGALEPELPSLEPLLFHGRSSSDAMLAIRSDRAGDRIVSVDGVRCELLPRDQLIVGAFSHRGVLFEEVFELPPLAVHALMAHLQHPRLEPQWRWAATLYEQGIVDGDFELTERGHRLFGGLVRRDG